MSLRNDGRVDEVGFASSAAGALLASWMDAYDAFERGEGGAAAVDLAAGAVRAVDPQELESAARSLWEAAPDHWTAFGLDSADDFARYIGATLALTGLAVAPAAPVAVGSL